MSIFFSADHQIWYFRTTKPVIMRHLLLFLFVSFVVEAQAQDLVIAAGTTKTLTAAERTMTLRKLTIGDNAVIVIPASMDGWTVVADDVSIGMNVRIVGNGVNGNSGTNGNHAVHATQPCVNGLAGQLGTPGVNGTNGKMIELRLKIRSFGSLNVSVVGGHGGNGGRGGMGGNGGTARCATSGTACRGGAGGKGGNGAAGGRGGAGGSAKIEYRKIGNITIDPAKIVVNTLGGNGGAGGSPGAGGLGGRAVTCTFSSNQSAGPNGLTGTPGVPGSNGIAGTKAVGTY